MAGILLRNLWTKLDSKCCVTFVIRNKVNAEGTSIANFLHDRGRSECLHGCLSVNTPPSDLRHRCVCSCPGQWAWPAFGTTFVHNSRFHSSSILQDDHVLSVPPFAESVTEGDVRWEKNVGDSVAVDEVVCEIETDKTSIPVPSPIAGTLEERLVDDGATVKAGQQLCRIKLGEGDDAASTGALEPPHKQEERRLVEAEVVAAAVETSASAPSESAAPTVVGTRTTTLASPPPPLSQQTTPAAKTDLPMAALRHVKSLDAVTAKVPPQDPTAEICGTRTEQRVKMNRMRQRIAQRLKDAQNTAAMLTTFNEVDMSNLMAFRKSCLEAFQKKHGVKLGFMSAFLKAAAYALQEQPIVNAVIDGNEIVYRDYVDISVAVATPKGLVVPVVRNVEGMTYAEIEKAIAELGEKARNNALAVEDMDGGTFTVSNGGVFGSLMGTPIINPPQSAILGMHSIVERPVALNSQVVVRPMMYVALTYDHRLIDGREAVLFLRKIKASVENPAIIVAGV